MVEEKKIEMEKCNNDIPKIIGKRKTKMEKCNDDDALKKIRKRKTKTKKCNKKAKHGK